MSFERPDLIKIGHIHFDLEDQNYDLEDEHVYGQFDHKNGRIGINPDQPPEFGQDTVVHESLHAMFWVAGWNPTQEERIVRTLTPMICAWIKDNPELMMYLQEQREIIPTKLPQDQNAP